MPRARHRSLFNLWRGALRRHRQSFTAVTQRIGLRTMLLATLALLLSALAFVLSLVTLVVSSLAPAPGGSSGSLIEASPGGALFDATTGKPGGAVSGNHFDVRLEPLALKPSDGEALIRVIIHPPTNWDAQAMAGRPYLLYFDECHRDPCSPDGHLQVQGDDVGTAAVALPVSMRGNAMMFPSDAYEVTASVGFDMLNKGTTSTDQRTYYDLQVVGPRSLADLRLSVADTRYADTEGVWGKGIPTDVRLVDFLYTRNALTTGYVYAVAAAPLVFAIVLAQLIFRRIRSRPTVKPLELGTLYVGLAAAGLTILPLRSTLIPAEIQGSSLTRLDFILGAELGLLAFLAAAAHAKWLVTRAN
jgi:hypothetical protein